MQPLSGNQRPDLLTPLMNMSLVLCLPREMHLCRSSANVPRLPSFLEMLSNPMFCSLLTRCRIPCACHAKPHLNLQKWSEHVVFSSRRNGVHFFGMSTSKNAPSTVCFVHFDFEMCFAPQGRAIFHLSSGQMAPHPSL